MVTFMYAPKFLTTITHSAVAYTPDVIQGRVQRVENGFDSATLIIDNSDCSQYGLRLTAGDALTIQVKDVSDAAYTTIFSGIIAIACPILGDNHKVKVECLGAGYGFDDTVCGQEYGSTSRNPSLDTIYEILADASNGIIPKWVNKILGSATNSGFNYTNTIEDIVGTIPYYVSPYKPNNKTVDDICDILTAIKAGAAGPHWIVDTNSRFLLSTVANHSIAVIAAGWDTYYGGGPTTATVVEGRDFENYTFEKLKPEANYIVYYGNWSRPANCDAWTENNSGAWGAQDCVVSDDSDAADRRVNSYAILITLNHAVNPFGACYPSGMNWAYDFSGFREYNVPTFNFWIKRGATADLDVNLVTGGVGSFTYTLQPGPLASAGKWYHICLPIGEYYKMAGGDVWTDAAGDWSHIDYVIFDGSAANTKTIHVDGMHFGGAAVCRVAKNSTNITANKLKVKVITDRIGKDDSLVAADATGTMAQMAYAELLKCQTTPTVGEFTTSMIKDVLPGQLLHVHAEKVPAGTFNIDMNMRIQKLMHFWNEDSASTTFTVTSDVTNSETRTRYGDWNTVFAAARPEFQDRQAASLKAGDMDIRITPLEKDYP